MLKAIPAQLDAVKINADAFMALSKIGFSSIERLATLNLNATRAALESGAEAASRIHSKGAKSLPDLHGLVPEAAIQSATTYLQGVQEIATETQKEVTTLMSSYFSSQGKGTNASADWTKGFDMFNNFGQQIIAMTEANSKAVADATQVKKHA